MIDNNTSPADDMRLYAKAIIGKMEYGWDDSFWENLTKAIIALDSI